MLNRRHFLGGVAAMSAWPAFPALGQTFGDLPILFVHSNGDQAPTWLTTLWRFESNGYRRDRLHAINFSDPLARDVDAVAQPNRSSTEDQLRELSEAVDRIRTASGTPRLALVGLSRGGNAIRNYVSAPEHRQCQSRGPLRHAQSRRFRLGGDARQRVQRARSIPEPAQ
jgi:pimeloyl-ACP methyl ester carboxylesterase